MRRAQPVLGYPSRSAACRALRALGLSNAEIVARFAADGHAITPKQINALLHYQQLRDGIVRVPAIVVTRLAPAAAARGVKVTELMEELLAVIARDGMVEAVLDDRAPETNHEER